MRWPFGPPHMTLKLSKKNKKGKKNKPTKNKKGLGSGEVAKKGKNKKYQKRSFSAISQNFLCLSLLCPKNSFTTWPKKRAPPKHYKKRVSANPKNKNYLVVTKRSFLDKKTQNPKKIQLSFLGGISSFLTTKRKNPWKPIFIVFFAKPKKVLKINLKQGINKTVWAHKKEFRNLPDNWTKKRQR